MADLGMGRAHALVLAKAGARVMVADISSEECEKVVKEIEKNGGEAMAIKCDVSKKEEVDKMIETVVKKWGKLDILINNAGIAQFVPFLQMTEAEWDKTININLKGYFLCAQAAAKEMQRQGSGAIVNIASVAMGQVGVGFPNLTHYCASKGGIVGMSEAMAIELAPYNIRVNVVSPGAIDTPMIDPVKQDKAAMAGILARVPLRRVGKPEEVANAVLFLASDESSYMTGSVVVVDGGWLAA
ncbi:MAG: Short-chain dehydrogenase/reductase SDR [Candidatus Roizmanbacteria bacterium GW2011_GWC2_41_7]|uniref:Short-chain dehydrogenase/reductase SDR n=1 Tax=Candidatus Roizmanbacteria bacterium GW2011_GWC2_41_7 TaxID=1618487 RepID=A0A0G0ZA79_9BACT|nr:MAG: Short-chain dehydrogenase/reductase SDR [Candidatus Roizmanbacteria bacterium GW2011_GWC2_41_7]